MPDINNPEDTPDSLEGSSQLPNPDLITRFVKEVGVESLLPEQKETKLKIEDRQEITRSKLATFLLQILGGTLIASFVLISILTFMVISIDENKKDTFKENSALVKDLITFIITAQTGLIGTALGFYFGSKSNNSD